MKKILGMIAVLALVCFTTMVFAADAAGPVAAASAAANSAVKAEATKALSGQTVIGTITKIDMKAKTIVISKSTINAKADQIAKLKVGEKVRVTLAKGTMDAEKIVSLEKEAVKKGAKKEAKQAKDKAVQTAADKALEKVSQ